MKYKEPHRIFTWVAAAATALIAAALIAVGAPAASAAPRVIDVSGIITGFTPKTISVTVGEEVSICLTSKDIDHDLTIPTVNDFQVVAKTGPPVCKTLTAPAKAGKYKFICSIPGHEAAGMVGSLVVLEAGAAVPAAPGTGAAPQVGQVPAGGVAAGSAPNAGLTNVSLPMLGGVLLVVAMMFALLGWSVARKA